MKIIHDINGVHSSGMIVIKVGPVVLGKNSCAG